MWWREKSRLTTISLIAGLSLFVSIDGLSQTNATQKKKAPTEQKKKDEEPKSGLVASLKLVAGFRPVYFYDSGEYQGGEVSLGYNFGDLGALVALGRGSNVEGRRKKVGFHVEEKRLDYVKPFELNEDMAVTTILRSWIPTSEESEIETKRATTSPRAIFTYSGIPMLDASFATYYSRSFYHETRASSGLSNSPYSYTFGPILEFKPVEGVTLSAFYLFVERFLYEGETQHLFAAGAGFEWQMIEEVAFTADALTRNTQIRHGETNYKVYEGNVTETELGIKYSF